MFKKKSQKINWSVTSKKDSRWNGGGFFYSVSALDERAVNEHVEKCKKKYGKMPDDLEYSCMKD